jgi:hypothetical protein
LLSPEKLIGPAPILDQKVTPFASIFFDPGAAVSFGLFLMIESPCRQTMAPSGFS